MAELSLDGDELVLTLSDLEKAESIHRDIRVPLSSVRDIEVVKDIIHAVHGLRMPGARWPGKVAVGRFVGSKGGTTFAVVHHDTPRGLKVSLDGASYDQLLIGSDDPEGMKARISDPPTTAPGMAGS